MEAMPAIAAAKGNQPEDVQGPVEQANAGRAKCLIEAGRARQS